ncbi:cysteine desulfurase family protein [Futiania mangrovi]|uniref:Cysteine desulfurase n=1 Tax=Futiania mangrovi TaxID=2959716 RepID=A0A9J6PD11_9PROT|nr:cysteine desulfurase family protein [Futiania mangrovii]MCP1335696.1 cysteine desulfurase [Futiania mangrovii]
MTRARTYLDANATAPLLPDAREAMVAALDAVGNPSSVHEEGRRAKRTVETARAAVADLFGAAPRNVVFMSGGTEANHLALRGLGGVRRLLVSAVEHDCVMAAAKASGRAVTVLPVDAQGRVSAQAVCDALGADGADALVSVMAANNETGVIQPIAEIAEAAHLKGALMHCDAAQAPGRMALSGWAHGPDLVTLSAHKMGGPQGVGALIVKDGIELAALLTGGGQEMGRRAGTEAVAVIAGFGAAAAALGAWEQELLAGLRDRFETAVREAGGEVAGAGVPRLANTSCAILPGVPAETQVMTLDLGGISVSAGSACSSGKVRRSHVLEAMGLDEERAGSAIRVSLPWSAQEDDVERLIAAWRVMAARLAPRHREKVA